MRCFVIFLVSVMAAHYFPSFLCVCILCIFSLSGEAFSTWRACSLCSGLVQWAVRSPCEVKKTPELRVWNKPCFPK